MEVVPTKVSLKSEGGVSITWSDGTSSLVAHAELRRVCPCASCKDSPPTPVDDSPDSLPILGQEPIRALRAVPIGRYAIQFFWSDGHDAGIYTYDYLRGLFHQGPHLPH